MSLVLHTPRLILRPIAMKDAPAIQTYFPVWDIVKFLSTKVPWPYPDDGAHTYITQTLVEMKEKKKIAWAITLKAQGDECIGVIAYMSEDLGLGNRGFWLALPFHGRGYMTEAVTAVQNYLFFELGVKTIRAMCAADNVGSRRIKAKTGAIFVGHTDANHHSGETKTEVWEVSIENWRAFQNR